MLTLILIVALIILLISVIVAAIRRHDANNYFDQDRDPFYAEPSRLSAAGLLYEQKDKDGRPRRTYTVTPAGEAALRAWLSEPSKDPGMLKLYFAGMVAPADVVDLARSRRGVHVARLGEYERLEQLLVNRPEWRYALSAVRVGCSFERSCLQFWDQQLDDQSMDGLRPTRDDRGAISRRRDGNGRGDPYHDNGQGDRHDADDGDRHDGDRHDGGRPDGGRPEERGAEDRGDGDDDRRADADTATTTG